MIGRKEDTILRCAQYDPKGVGTSEKAAGPETQIRMWETKGYSMIRFRRGVDSNQETKWGYFEGGSGVDLIVLGIRIRLLKTCGNKLKEGVRLF